MKPGPGIEITGPPGPCTLTLSKVTLVPGIHLAKCDAMPARLPPEMLADCVLGKLAPEKYTVALTIL